VTHTATKDPASKGALEQQALLHKVLADPLRARILMVLGDREASPKELAEFLDEDFQQVCYRVRTLKEKGFVELVDEDSRNGGVQHFYKASARPRLDADEWEQLPELARKTNSATALQAVIRDARQAMASGDFDAHRHRVLIRKPMVVDEQGMRELDESALRQLDEQERIETESANRRIESGERGISVRAVTIVHPTAGSGLKSTNPEPG
jgi:DNA-binding transcriptional ArsR family regulator